MITNIGNRSKHNQYKNLDLEENLESNIKFDIMRSF